MGMQKLKAPFPWFGGKSRVAGMVWERLGDVDNYIEPFCGSAAILIGRPHAPRFETLNDADRYVANFWRATQHAPDAVADGCNWPVNEADLHARHRWLIHSDEAAAVRARVRVDPEFYDVKVAAWWCWGLCQWIGGGWCKVESRQLPELDHRRGVTSAVGAVEHRLPVLGDRKGTARRPNLGDTFSRGHGVHGNDSLGECATREAWLRQWFGRLRDRLRSVRVCCGDWLRVCDSETVTTRLGTTGIFFDPPYSAEAGRDMGLYAVESGTVAHDVRAYCLERGNDHRYRICLAGYEGEGHEELERAGWSVVAWRASGGYGSKGKKNDNAGRERLWFSPHCQAQPGLFDGLEAA